MPKREGMPDRIRITCASSSTANLRQRCKAVFPHVNLWSQNHSEAIAFVPSGSFTAGDFDAPRDSAPEHAHFFLAACSQSPIRETRAFAWLPSSGNVLREREHHIELLKTEVKRAQEDHAVLHASHEDLLGELKATHAGYQGRVQELETDAAVRLDWVHDLEAQIGRGRNEIARLELESAERTRWAQSLDAELERTNARLRQSEAQLRLAARSKWLRLGRLLHLGPRIVTEGQPGDGHRNEGVARAVPSRLAAAHSGAIFACDRGDCACLCRLRLADRGPTP